MRECLFICPLSVVDSVLWHTHIPAITLTQAQTIPELETQTIPDGTHIRDPWTERQTNRALQLMETDKLMGNFTKPLASSHFKVIYRI